MAAPAAAAKPRFPVAAPRLIVGLGNPGAEYEDTRHNAGFWLCRRLAERLGAELRRESRFHGLAGRTRDQVWLLQPLTFMNRSGQAVAALARFHRIAPAETLVLHDDLDLPPGVLRLKFGGGLGGHNGLKDIVAQLGTQDFWRLRIGIGHPGDRDQVALARALDHWPLIACGDYAAAMQQLNAKGNP